MARKSTKSQGPELDLSDVDHRVGKPIGGGQLWDPCSSLRHPPLGDGDGLSQSAALGPGVRAGIQVRRHRRAAVHRGGPGLRARRSAGMRRAHSEQPPDFRRRGMVVLRLPRPARRPAVPGAPVPRLQSGRDEVRRAHDVLARRHHPHQPARRPGGARAFDRDPLSLRRSQETRHVRKPARRHETLDATPSWRRSTGCAATGWSPIGWASRRISTKSRSETRCRAA